MLRIAGKTAGPIRLTFFVDNHGWPGGIKVKKNRHIFFQNYSMGKRLVIQLVINKIQPNNYYMQMGVSNNIKG